MIYIQMQEYEELASLEEEYRFGNVTILINRNKPQQKVMLKYHKYKTQTQYLEGI